MLISEMLKDIAFLGNGNIINEKDFKFFSRITSEIDEPVCIFIGEKKFVDKIPGNATMIITTSELYQSCSGYSGGFCLTDEPKVLYFLLLNHYSSTKTLVKFEKKIGKGCIISPYAYIEDSVIIGDNVTIEEFACIYQNTIIGDNCVIHSGAKIGIQDYNFFKMGPDIIHLFHAGKTILGKCVDIGNNTVVGRALYDYHATKVGDYCKIGCNSSIGHDCEIGNNVMIYANVSIGGYTIIGNKVNIALGATIKNAVAIGEAAKIQMGSVLINDVSDGKAVFGNPARKFLE